MPLELISVSGSDLEETEDKMDIQVYDPKNPFAGWDSSLEYSSDDNDEDITSNMRDKNNSIFENTLAQKPNKIESFYERKKREALETKQVDYESDLNFINQYNIECELINDYKNHLLLMGINNDQLLIGSNWYNVTTTKITLKYVEIKSKIITDENPQISFQEAAIIAMNEIYDLHVSLIARKLTIEIYLSKISKQLKIHEDMANGIYHNNSF